MTKKSIHEIMAEHSAKAAGILRNYHDEVDRIRDDRRLEGDASILERLDGGGRLGLLRSQKKAKADAARSRSIEEYRRQFDAYERSLTSRRSEIADRLFGLSSPEAAGLLSRAATASEEELGTMIDLARASGNGELAKAALIAADQRGFDSLRARALEHAGPQAQSAYEEWQELPAPETLDRQHEDIPRMLPSPEPAQLEGTPPINS